MTNASPRRVAALDGVRGLAIVLVVVDHAADGAVKFSGAIGVTLFFTLSGYLITRLLVDEHRASGRIDFTGFYLRRAARLLPALAVVLCLTPVVLWVAHDPQLVDYPGHATY